MKKKHKYKIKVTKSCERLGRLDKNVIDTVLDFSKVKLPKTLGTLTLYRSEDYHKCLQDFPELKHLEIKDSAGNTTQAT